jgi:hypothetical protein
VVWVVSELSPWTFINIVPCDLKSECPFFKIERVDEDQCVVYCDAADRYLTRHNARKCASPAWSECPFYRLHVKELP